MHLSNAFTEQHLNHRLLLYWFQKVIVFVLFWQVQHHCYTEAGVGSCGFVLAHLFSDWPSAYGRLAPQSTWKCQYDAHPMPVHQCHAHGLYGLLQLLSLGGGSPDHHDWPVRRDLPRDKTPAQPPSRGHLRLQQVLPQRAETCKVISTSSVSLCTLLAATSYHEQYCVFLPHMPSAQECFLCRHLYVTHQLRTQPASVCLPHPALP